jgi:hypothetical protein
MSATATSEVTVYLRPYEQVSRVINTNAGHCSRSGCGKDLVHAMFNWSDEAPFTVTTGRVNHTQIFGGYRHADGTYCGDPATFDMGHVCSPKPVCPVCGTEDSFKREMLAYGDQVTCTACNDSHYYSIGD